jgi:hypothetical protein
MHIKLFGKVFEFPKKKLYFCSVQGCRAQTSNHANTGDVRKRWMLGQQIGDETENEIVNICPEHVKIFFGLREEDYVALETGEKLATGKIGVGEWKNAISSIRG